MSRGTDVTPTRSPGYTNASSFTSLQNTVTAVAGSRGIHKAHALELITQLLVIAVQARDPFKQGGDTCLDFPVNLVPLLQLRVGGRATLREMSNEGS